jgi:predicted nucleotidyltransferase
MLGMNPAEAEPPSERQQLAGYLAGHVDRARARERSRVARRIELESAARAAVEALRGRYGADIDVYLFGSVLDPHRFRLDSDLDLAVRGVPAQRYFEACQVAESAAATTRLDLVRLEDAPPELVREVLAHGRSFA